MSDSNPKEIVVLDGVRLDEFLLVVRESIIEGGAAWLVENWRIGVSS